MSQHTDETQNENQKVVRPRRKKLLRISDWDDGIHRILSWPGMQGHHPMFGPAVSIGLQTGVLNYSVDMTSPTQTSNHRTNGRNHKTKLFLTAEDLNKLRPPSLLSVGISFVVQATEGGAGLTYERLIHDHGLVLTRNNSWHDVLNALVWFYFPRGKRALNRFQCAAADAWSESRAAERKVGKGRSPLQSRLAHFDECGGIVILPPQVEDQPDMFGMLENHDWTGLLFHNRHQWLRGGACMLVFGHGLLEQGLVRVPTMVAHSLVFVLGAKKGESELNQMLSLSTIETMNENELVEFVDRLMETYFNDLTKTYNSLRASCETASDLDCAEFITSPIPILGIPGWSELNCKEDYYKNSSQFR